MVSPHASLCHKAAMQKIEHSELYEQAGRQAAYRLLSNAEEQGFFSYGILTRQAWEQIVEEQGTVQADCSEGKPLSLNSLRTSSPWTEQLKAESSPVMALKERYHLSDVGAMLVVALRYAPDVEAEEAAARALRGLPPLPLLATAGQLRGWQGLRGATGIERSWIGSAIVLPRPLAQL